jgi:modified peptide precursor CbpA
VPTLPFQHRRDACATKAIGFNRKQKTENRPLTAYTPAAAAFGWPRRNPPRKEDPYMSKESSSKKPISIRYTCAPNGDQVGLSHYLMADAKKAKK